MSTSRTVSAASAGGSGTAFPTSPAPAAGDRFWRTDLKLDCCFDGTRWLSVQEYEMGAGQQVSAPAAGITTSPSTVVRCAVRSDYDLYLTRWVNYSRVLTTNNGSNNWIVALTYQIGNATATTIASFTTAADTVGNLVNHDQNINAVLNAAAEGVSTTVTINAGAPGAIYAPGSIWYRLIVT